MNEDQINTVVRQAWELAHEPDAGLHASCMLKGCVAVIKELQSRIESIEKENKHLNDGCAELEAQILSLEKDAARYRWLKADGEDVDVVRARSDLFNFEWGDELDAAIDAAMKG